MKRVTFYFDLGSPFAYLAAERLDEVLGEDVAWQPVSLGAIFKATGRSSWALGEPAGREAGMAEVQRRASLYGLPSLRWPDPWPSNYLFAMRVATYAFQIGRGRELTLGAFRDSFVRGRDLGRPEHVLSAAADAGLDVADVATGAEDPDTKLALRSATEAAQARGVFGVPTVAVGDELFWGDDRLEEAAAALAR
ncbi:MAG TPA: 2-hydroxychromene-2-carboxylate isomerase [Solirubrobacteraceae bacterium]|jgi:2-hydroxychromene-2-carboxylate isomerase